MTPITGDKAKFGPRGIYTKTSTHFYKDPWSADGFIRCFNYFKAPGEPMRGSAWMSVKIAKKSYSRNQISAYEITTKNKEQRK